MNPLIIELDEITSNLTPGELLTLKSIYTSNKKAFEKLSNEYGSYIPNVLESLQNKLYIKIQGEEFDELICREKAELLFSEKGITFEEFWDLYHTTTHLPKTDNKPARSKWNRLTKGKKKLAIDNIRAYYDSLSDKRYCKKARTYLEDENFMDEFKVNNGGSSGGIFSLTGEN
jgi:hypothetical protein